ncbi:hypothetical protein I4U30_21760 [Enterobacter asburiae]|uniref:hypothetical protein n=1 Tax=Enterobacter asburiae TaxID=61645 RepID=UPI00192BEE80|nr:hypothetical protein [Enterobacter asburiae]MBL5840896.1 hypothetical protein [Enterobacter asburiae]
MKKDLDQLGNVAFLISELEDYVDMLDLSIYDDYQEMKLAQKEVLKILKSLRLRRENEIQRRRSGR